MVTDRDGRVVAEGSPAHLGADLAGEPPPCAPRCRPDRPGRRPRASFLDHRALPLAVPIVADYDPSAVIGALFGLVDWRFVERMLADASIAGHAQGRDVVLALLATREQRSRTVSPRHHGEAGPTRQQGGHPGAERGGAGGRASGGGHELLYLTQQAEGLFSPEALAGSRDEGTVAEVPAAGTGFIVTSAFSRGSGLFRDPGWELHAALTTDAAFGGLGRIQPVLRPRRGLRWTASSSAGSAPPACRAP